MQELLRHSTIRVTLDTYAQAVTTEKRNAQDAVVALLPAKNAIKSSAWRDLVSCTYFVPFCAHAKTEHFR